MDIILESITKDKEPVLKNMLELYSYDFTDFVDSDLNEEGSYGYPLDKYNYFGDPGRQAFFIRVDSQLAGFVLLRILHDEEGKEVHSIAEFFILRKYRRQGIGRKVAVMVFEKYPGRWEVDQVDINYPAHTFWRSVINDFTQGQFTERHAHGRMIQEFSVKE